MQRGKEQQYIVRGHMKRNELKPCPFCKTIWVYVSDGDYYSGYEANGYRANCQCGFAWIKTDWQKTEKGLLKMWNRNIER